MRVLGSPRFVTKRKDRRAPLLSVVTIHGRKRTYQEWRDSMIFLRLPRVITNPAKGRQHGNAP